MNQILVAALLAVQGDGRFVPLQIIPPFEDLASSVRRVLAFSDLNGDGYSELAYSHLGSGYYHETGVVYILSGLDRTPMLRLVNDPTISQPGLFGADLARGKVAGLGREAIIVGDYQGSPIGDLAGQIVVFDPVTGAKIGVAAGEPYSFFGTHLTSGVDLDGDGQDEILVGAPNALTSGNSRLGKVYLLDGAMLTTRFEWKGTTSGEGFHGPFDFLDDLDGDGVPEILLASPTWDLGPYSYVGKVMIASGSTGQVIWTGTGTSAFKSYGAQATRIGDLTGDGKSEYGWFEENITKLRVYGGFPPQLVLDIDLAGRVIIPRALEGIADRTGDGVRDIIISGLDPPYGSVPGRILVFSGATGDAVMTLLPPRGSTFNGAFAGSLAELADVTGDGQPDLVCANTSSPGDGEVCLFQSKALLQSKAPLDDAASSPSIRLKAPSHPNGLYALLFSNAVRDGIPYVTRTIPLGESPLLYWSVDHPIFGLLDGNGEATVSFDVPPDLLQGGARIFACWLGLDGAAPYGLKVISNALNVTEQ